MQKRTKQIILTLLIGLNLIFIWGNSAMTGEESGDLSQGVLEWIVSFLPVFAQETGHLILRKLAHFSEFACLGLLSGALMRLKTGKVSVSLWGAGLAVACIDETIQYFVPGRASSVLDVWIDASGFAVGTLVLLAGYAIYRKLKTEELS